MGEFEKVSISMRKEHKNALDKIVVESGGKYRGRSHLLDVILKDFDIVEESNKVR